MICSTPSDSRIELKPSHSSCGRCQILVSSCITHIFILWQVSNTGEQLRPLKVLQDWADCMAVAHATFTWAPSSHAEVEMLRTKGWSSQHNRCMLLAAGSRFCRQGGICMQICCTAGSHHRSAASPILPNKKQYDLLGLTCSCRCMSCEAAAAFCRSISASRRALLTRWCSALAVCVSPPAEWDRGHQHMQCVVEGSLSHRESLQMRSPHIPLSPPLQKWATKMGTSCGHCSS